MASAKERHRIKLLEYLSNPDNDFPNRTFLSQKVLGFSRAQQINIVFTPDELQEIENEALAERRKRCAKHSIKVDLNVVRQAQNGDNPKWAELYYKRFEGWVEKTRQEHTGKDGDPIQHQHELSPEAQGLLDELIGDMDTASEE